MLNEIKQCDILGLTEHWKCKEELEEYRIANFNLASSFCRRQKKHGGSAIYCKQGIKYTRRTDLENLSILKNFECSAISLNTIKSKINIVCIYCPPKSCFQNILNKLNTLLQLLLKEKAEIVIMGDFNVDMLEPSNKRTEFFSLLESYNININFKEPTRISIIRGITVKSCLDNILTTVPVSRARVVEFHLSDHKGQIIYVDLNKTSHGNFKKTGRIFSKINIEKFKNELKLVFWEEILKPSENLDINTSWSNFSNIFSKIFNTSFPIKELNDTPMKHPTYTPEIREIKNLLDYLLVASQYNDVLLDAYKEVKHKYNNALKENQTTFFGDMIENAKNKTKTTWQIVKRVSKNGSTKAGKDSGDELPSMDSEQLANDFNDFFVNTAPNLAQTIPSIDFVNTNTNFDRSLYLFPVTVEEVIKTCKNLKSKNSCGLDGVPSSLLIQCIPEIAEPICFLINKSHAQGRFPEMLKPAVVLPLYKKKGSKENLDNYRPISLLSVFSKLFEKIMANRIIHFFNKFKLFNKCQHGFTSGKSVTTAIFELVQAVSEALESKSVPCGIMLDLSKAFDCVDHDILFQKLYSYGVRGIVLDWFKSYLGSRSQVVKVTRNGVPFQSQPKQISMGVPQGSIIGPLLFIIYLNDLPNIFNDQQHHMICYADDTNIFLKANDLNDLAAVGGDLFPLVERWFLQNRLLLNIQKTQCVIFQTKRSTLVAPETICFDETTLKLEKEIKCLGVSFNANLNYSCHVDSLLTRLNCRIYCIRVLRDYFKSEKLKIIYFANFDSLLRFGILFWGSSADIQAVFVAQKRCIRLIYRMAFRATCRDVFKSNCIMTVYALYIYECLVFLYKNKSYFTSYRAGHHYQTRDDLYQYPRHTLTLYEKGPHYQCMKFYNALPQILRNITHFSNFKHSLKIFLIEAEPYNINEFYDYCANS